MNRGMGQAEARKRAKELGGIAAEARWSEAKQKWVTGGWASAPGKAWIVTSLDGHTVLDDKGLDVHVYSDQEDSEFLGEADPSDPDDWSNR